MPNRVGSFFIELIRKSISEEVMGAKLDIMRRKESLTGRTFRAE